MPDGSVHVLLQLTVFHVEGHDLVRRLFIHREITTQQEGQITTAASPVVFPLFFLSKSFGSSIVRRTLHSGQDTKTCSGVRPSNCSLEENCTRLSLGPSTFMPAKVEKKGVPPAESSLIPAASGWPSCTQWMSAVGSAPVALWMISSSSATTVLTAGTKCCRVRKIPSCKVTALCGHPRHAPWSFRMTCPSSSSHFTNSTSPPSA
mmetsp:Transcript_42112/g.63610  ORF Transcript_42112/g.63610 Transcript_42112/m.63610 type:complete len:205 (+) Transcript_42112:225-839(+)